MTRRSDEEKAKREAEEARRRAVLASVTEVMEPYRLEAEAVERDAAARPRRQGIPVSTANDLPGYEVTEYVGEVFGNVVRSRGALPQLGAQVKAGFGGEIRAMTDLLSETRRVAIDRMVADAVRMNADAVIAVRVEVASMGVSLGNDWTEICAYGTAVRVRRKE